jgi:hypothetical protein
VNTLILLFVNSSAEANKGRGKQVGFLGNNDQTKVVWRLGFRDIELFNLALLPRQAYHTLMNPETLSARILKACYFSLVSILEVRLASSPSSI